MKNENAREVDLTLDEIKQIELDVLIHFDEVCKKHSLKYSLAYGTALGAIRHGGFIPWDDDIDVMMPRPDYLRFLKICNHELKGTKYSVASMYLDEDYFSPLTKMYNNETRVYQSYGQVEDKPTGVYIDIFVVDGLPEKDAEEFYNKAQKLRREWAFSVRKLFSKERTKDILRVIVGSIIAIPYKIKGMKKTRTGYDSFCASYDYDSSQNVGVVLYGEGILKERLTRDRFESDDTIKFEGHSFSIISDVEGYLAQMYGDFMKLPPVEQRISKHHSKMVKLI